MNYDLFSQPAEAPRAQITTIPAQPEEVTTTTPARRVFTNIADIITEVRGISYAEKMTFAEFQALYIALKEQKAAIMGMINAMTKAEILKFIYSRSSTDTKAELVESLYSNIMGSFTLNEGISYVLFGPETYEQARDKTVMRQTAETLKAYQDGKQADRDKRKKAIENPETLEEYRIFLQYRRHESMTTEQRTRYDELITEGKQERREINARHAAEVTAVKVEGLQMEIKTSHHAKKNIPLWVVVMSDRVDSTTFADLKVKAHKFDGYYSSYRGQGAIPGFTFETEEGARLFCGLQDGNQNAHELNKAIEQETRQERAETLEEKAARIKAEAETALNADRKTNTHKRAGEARRAEEKALYNIEFADTMQKIAEGQKAGTIKYLTHLKTITELQTLNGLLANAKYRYIQAKKINTQREDTDQLNTSPEIVDYVQFPYPRVYKENALSDILKLSNAPGCKLAAARMIKRFKANKEEYYNFTTGREIEDFEILLCTPRRSVKIYTDSYKADILEYRRVMRMQIESLPELRTALRELIAIKKGTAITPEMKKAQELRELERKFIGVDIPGFFPTPRALAEEVVNLADVQPGNTILEPSAGLGHLAEIIEELHPDNPLTVCEISYSLWEALRLKGFDIAEREDFLNHAGRYDRIIMNPPFENGQDIDHVRHAYSLLNDGGRVVAIMAGNKANSSNQKAREFMEFVNEHGEFMENPAGSFLSAFRPTGVNTITVILNK